MLGRTVVVGFLKAPDPLRKACPLCRTSTLSREHISARKATRYFYLCGASTSRSTRAPPLAGVREDLRVAPARACRKPTGNPPALPIPRASRPMQGEIASVEGLFAACASGR
jgi:hypothetical protein